MKKQISISKKWRKLTAVLLLLSFAITPVLTAFPQENCNGVCEMSSAIHECCTEIIEVVEKDCCDMMEMNSKNISITPSKCGMELSDINCALVFSRQVSTSYIIPKTLDSNVEFVQLTIVDLQKDNSKVELFELLHEFSFENKPPIYLTISSFLN